MAADLIENYEGHDAFRFFRDFNADCDWSEALMGEIGRYIVVARRAGESYFIGAGTDSEARTLELPLTFLPEGKTYTADIYADDIKSGDPSRLAISSRTLTSADTLTIQMAPTGGQAVTLVPVRN